MERLARCLEPSTDPPACLACLLGSPARAGPQVQALFWYASVCTYRTSLATPAFPARWCLSVACPAGWTCVVCYSMCCALWRGPQDQD